MVLTRRHVLRSGLAIGLGGALGARLLAGAPALAQSAGSLITEYDFESGNIGSLRPSGNAPTASTEAARAGRYAMRSFIDQKNSSVPFRTEIEYFPHFRIGEEYWVGISIRVSEDWIPTKSREILLQVHDAPSDWTRPRNPMVFLETMEAARGAVWRYTNAWNSVFEGDIKTQKIGFQKELGPVIPGEWVDWVFNWRWDWRENGTGFSRIWKQGKLVADYAGPNCYNDVTGPYLKFGVYKWDWKDRNFVDTVTKRLVYHDEFRVAGADGSYALVAPRGAVAPNAPSLSVS